MNRAQSELVSTLHRLPLFTDLSDQELAVIAENITCLHYDEDAVIFSEGDACHELLVVEEGSKDRKVSSERQATAHKHRAARKLPR